MTVAPFLAIASTSELTASSLPGIGSAEKITISLGLRRLSLIVTHRFFKILREHLFRRSKSGSFSAKAIRKQGRNAFLCCLCYFEKFRPFLVSRSQIEFVVRSMVEVAHRCFNEKVCCIWYGVRDMDIGNGEITNLQGARSKWNRLDKRLSMEFGQFFIGKGGCER